uniref:Biotin operon repressor/biotin carboxyl carrier protein n=1 Tax=Pseudomonas mutabilis TaxID=499117 RepID=B1PCF9_9PSED|nr:biotin operon repressor/biotin carboxyl carrier protein [Pseudomonas mutabilis]
MQTLLKLLQDGRFHSGEALGAALGMSRSAVWKPLQHLETEHDLPIHKVRGRGYRLAGPLRLLDRGRMAHLACRDHWPGRIHQSLDSTNADGWRLDAFGYPRPVVVFAERPTARGGRRGRGWVSPYAENLYYRLGVRVLGGLRQVDGLRVLVGVAVVRPVRRVGVEERGFKWPNEVLRSCHKITGILLDLCGDPADICHVVIGMGVNVNMQPWTYLGQAWTSLGDRSGVLSDRNRLLADFTIQLRAKLGCHRQEGFLASLEEWEVIHLWQGVPVEVVSGCRYLEGAVVGVDVQGGLRVEVHGLDYGSSGDGLSLRLRQ